MDPYRNKYLQDYKPKDAPCHYDKCVKCGGHDASLVLSEFGLCLKCWNKYKKKIPRDVRIPLGRMLLYNSKGITKEEIDVFAKFCKRFVLK